MAKNATAAAVIQQPSSAGEQTGEKKGKAAPKAYVLDTTATHESGERTHELIINGQRKKFTFKPSEPLEVEAHVAAKFLHPRCGGAFKLCDNKGDVIEVRTRPRQPDELQAGERIELADDEVIARYDELSLRALFTRAIELPGGEKFATANDKPEAKELIDFILAARAKIREANMASEADRASDEYDPKFEDDED